MPECGDDSLKKSSFLAFVGMRYQKVDVMSKLFTSENKNIEIVLKKDAI